MIVNNSLDEVKKRENALSIIKGLVENKGRECLFDLTGLSGGFIASPSELSLLETYVGPAIFEDALQEVGIEHMGGEKVLPVNRTSSGILATILTSLIFAPVVGIILSIKRKNLKTSIPFGPFISLGALSVFFFKFQLLEIYENCLKIIYN